MSFEIPGFKFSRQAAADLSTHQYKAVVCDSNGRAALAGTQGVAIIGVLQDKPAALGRAAEIMQNGITKWVAAAAIAAGATVTTNNAGKAITAVAGNIVAGIALEASGADGNVIAVLLGSTHVKA